MTRASRDSSPPMPRSATILLLGSAPHAKRGRHGDQIGERIGPHLVHDVASVRLYGGLGDAELEANLLIQQPGDDKTHDVALTCGERAVARREHLQFGLAAQSSAAEL